MVKLFSKSFETRRLFEKRRHAETFIFLRCPGPVMGIKWTGHAIRRGPFLIEDDPTGGRRAGGQIRWMQTGWM
ncbi:hypothetical protein CXP35_11310 [Komagataeibacter xylinus]|nr:hypothetical protein CXP35_11310 [Komagataeibacter xylinus]